ncbi:MAG TPA: ECF-type sigma factor [Phycisphaerae bacterium]|nr:ECF-type sigma factor [Phycisphaerae bacterium]
MSDAPTEAEDRHGFFEVRGMIPHQAVEPSVEESSDSQQPSAFDELVAVLYGELRRMARRHLMKERSDHPLQTTALVHEAYLRLARSGQAAGAGRTQCLAAAAVAMRHILVEEARSMKRAKRGGGWSRVQLDGVADDPMANSLDLLALSDALEKLAAHDERKCMVIQMRFFAGLTNDEIAEALDTTTRTVERDWRYARAWLYRELASDRRADGNGRADVN